MVVGVGGVLEQRRPKADISKYCTRVSGFGDAGGTPPPKVPRSTPPTWGGGHSVLV